MKNLELSNFNIDDYYRNNKLYKGCVMKDQLGKKPKLGFYVINMQSSDQGSGSHWVCLIIDNKCAKYIDSFGAYPPNEVYIFMKRTNKLCVFSDMELQNENSKVCGYYCLYFINESLKGRKLSDIQKDFKLDDTNYNDKLVYSSVISGKGFFNNVIDGLTHGIRTTAPPKIRAMLEQYGDAIISNIQICRMPIQSYIEKFANFVTKNKWDANKKKLGYDKFYHLYMIITVNKNGQLMNIRSDKNHVVEMSFDLKKATDIMPVTINKEITLNELIDNGVKYQGEKEFWRYSADSNNCQAYICALLEGSNLMNPTIKAFVFQDPQKLFDQHGTLKKATQKVTDLANVADVIINGRSI